MEIRYCKNIYCGNRDRSKYHYVKMDVPTSLYGHWVKDVDVLHCSICGCRQ